MLLHGTRALCSSTITHAIQPKENRVFAHHAAWLVLVREEMFALAADRFQLLEHRDRLRRQWDDVLCACMRWGSSLALCLGEHMRWGSSLAFCLGEDPQYARDVRFPNHSVAKMAASRRADNVSEKLPPATVYPPGR